MQPIVKACSAGENNIVYKRVRSCRGACMRMYHAALTGIGAQRRRNACPPRSAETLALSGLGRARARSCGTSRTVRTVQRLRGPARPRMMGSDGRASQGQIHQAMKCLSILAQAARSHAVAPYYETPGQSVANKGPGVLGSAEVIVLYRMFQTAVRIRKASLRSWRLPLARLYRKRMLPLQRRPEKETSRSGCTGPIVTCPA